MLHYDRKRINKLKKEKSFEIGNEAEVTEEANITSGQFVLSPENMFIGDETYKALLAAQEYTG